MKKFEGEKIKLSPGISEISKRQDGKVQKGRSSRRDEPGQPNPKFGDCTYPGVACRRSETRSLSPRARPSSANVRLAQPVEGCGYGHTVSRAESAHLARYQTARADP